jgi:beta-mannosidase
LTIQPIETLSEEAESNAPIAVFAVNDCDATWNSSLSVKRMNFAGEVLAQEEVVCDISARTCESLFEIVGALEADDPTTELLVAETSTGERALWFFEPDKNLHYPDVEFESELNRTHFGYELVIRAKSLLRDVCVFVDRLDSAATVSDQLVTLLPGEKRTFQIETKLELSDSELTHPPVFRCVNPFGRCVALAPRGP